ncbi:MAG: peptidoglycan-binding domain-containing protein [Candidatus Nealsonbacteria bacterium]
MNLITKKKIVAIVTTVTLWASIAGPALAVTAEELQAQINLLMAQLATLQTQLAELQGETPTITGCTITSFDQNLKQGMSGDDVKCLQIVLNSSADTQLAASGVGSPGNETSYFGPITKAAVIKFQEKYADEILTSWGLTVGTGFVGSTSRAKLNTLLVVTDGEVIITGEGLTLTLAYDSPVSTTLIEGQALADLAHFKFINGDASDVKVTQLKIKRIGVSADTTLTALYLYEGNTRLSDNVSVAAGYATFNDPTGLFTVKAGKSVVISVNSNIYATAQGQTVGMAINSASDIVADASSVNGTFPISGNLHSIASATLASVSVATSTPSATGEVTPGETDYLVWGNTLTVSERNVDLKYLRLREIGSIGTADLQNFKLYISGSQVGNIVQMSDDYYVAFDLSASPVTLEPGARSVEVRADIIGGSGRSYSFSLRRAVDIVLLDTEFGVNITLTGTLPSTTLSQDVLLGNLVVNRTTDSPSGGIVKGASNVVLAKYEFKAYGEPIKVETLIVDCTITFATGVDVTLRNGRVYADGIQIGSPQNIACTTGVSYNLGSALIVEPGTPKILEIRSDIFDSEGTNEIVAGVKIRAILKGGTLNAQAQNSLSLVNVPAGDKEGYDLTVGVGTLQANKSSAYGNQNTVAGVSAFKIGSYVLDAGEGESVDISRITVGVTTTGAFSDLSNLYVRYGTETTSPKGIVSSANSFSLTYNLAASSQLIIEVYANLGSSLEETETVTTELSITARGHDTGTDVSITSAVPGQEIVIVASQISAALDASRPDASIMVAEAGNVALAKYKFTAKYADIGIKNLKVLVVNSTSTRSLVILGLDFNNDGIPDEEKIVTGVTTTLTSIFTVPSGQDKVISITADLNIVNTDIDNSGDDLQVKLVGYDYVVSGVSNTTTTSATGTTQIIRNTKPTISGAGIGSTILGNSTKELMHFTITADSHANVTWSSTTLSIALYDKAVASGTDSSLNLKLDNIVIKDSADNVISTTSTATTTEQSTTVTITLEPKSGSSELAVIPKGEQKTYKVIADVSGAADGDSVSTKLTGFVWGDQVATGIDQTYVVGIPTDSFGMSQ